jgi:hypothetical protein
VFLSLSQADDAKGKKWVNNVEMQPVVVAGDWLMKY